MLSDDTSEKLIEKIGSMSQRSNVDAVSHGLHDFSDVLISFLNNISGSVSKLQESQNDMIKTIKLLELNLEATTRELALLQMETSDQRRRVDDVSNNISSGLFSPTGTSNVEPFGQNFQDPTRPSTTNAAPVPSIVNEILAPQRTASISLSQVTGNTLQPSERSESRKSITAPKDFSIKFQLGQALNDAVHKFSLGAPKVTPHQRLNRTQSNMDPYEDRFQRVENSLLIQENINKISAAIVKSNNESSQFEIENLQNQIKKLEAELLSVKGENDTLKTSISDVYAKFIAFSNSRHATPRLMSNPGSTKNNLHILSSPTANSIAGSISSPLSALPSSIAAENSNSKFFENANPLQESISGKSTGNSMSKVVNFAPNPAITLSEQNSGVHNNSFSNSIYIDDRLSTVNARIDQSLQVAEGADRATKKLSTAVDDIYLQFEILREKVNNIDSSAGSSGIVESTKAQDDEERSLSKKIFKLRYVWENLFTDLKYGLLRRMVEKNEISKLSNPFDPTAVDETTVMGKADKFASLIQSSLPSFDSDDNLQSNLMTKVFPKLDELTAFAEELLSLDDAVVTSKVTQPVLDELHCEDGTLAARARIMDAINATAPVMEEIDDKVFIRRKLNKMEIAILKKAEFSSVKHIELELKRLIGTKLEREDLIQALEKKASLTDLDRIRDLIHRRLGDGKDGQVNSRGMSRGGEMSEIQTQQILEQSKNQIIEMKEIVGKEVADLSHRFELVHRHFKDLEVFCDSFVPRIEVEEAMQALFQEIKAMKSQSVTQVMLRDGLKFKADADELNRLVTSLTNAVGELNGYSEASALHARCLVCDKPVTTLSKARAATQVGYDKRDDIPEQDSLIPQTSNGKLSISNDRLNSPDRKMQGKVKVSTDITVLKNTIDLPPINDNAMSSKYHQRVRTSVGGGMGPGWTMDTR